ncbi:MAG: PEBP family protein [Pseudoruegeria sp.]
MKAFILCTAIVAGFALQSTAQQSRDINQQVILGTGADAFVAEIWVDNWFAAYVNGAPLAEDSVAYNTERSFNAEVVQFTADMPMLLAFEFRDFKENDTGLEYIGSNRQQMGDGGAIVQIKDNAGQVISVSNRDWRCLVVHQAPVQPSCAKESNPQVGQGACRANMSEVPADWTTAEFDDSGWLDAVEYSESAVRPKMGFDAIDWNSKAELIWSGDLERDNTVLCRTTIGG